MGMKQSFETIRWEEKQGVAWITLHRPDTLNAFTRQMNEEMLQALKIAEKQENIRAVLITGEGRAFCSGQDLADVDETMEHGEILRTYYNPMIEKIQTIEKPVVAYVNGVAAGAGMSVALACDYRLVHERATFIQSFVNVGLVPDSGAFYFLPRMIGTAKAFEWMSLGEKISAKEAERFSIVTKIITNETIKDVETFVTKLAASPTKAIGLMKRYLNESSHRNLQETLELEAQLQSIAGSTEDHHEGVQAFLQKRIPNYNGK